MNKDVIKKINQCCSCVTKPCQVGCPLNNDITEFIKLVKNKDLESAFEVISRTNPLPAVCGKVCNFEKQCMASCVKRISYDAVEIGDIECYIGEEAIKNKYKFSKLYNNKLGKKVAIVGGGPSGIACAYYLQRRGIDVTIFEKHDYLGGLLIHGIPDFRLSHDIVKQSIDTILKLGIKVKYKKELGRNISIKELVNSYDAVYVAIGANEGVKSDIKFGKLSGIIDGNKFLEDNDNIDFKDKNVIVNGGGNTAIDVARVIKRNGAKNVTIVYRRDEKSMPAFSKEVLEAKNENIKFIFNTRVINVYGKNSLEKVEVVKTENDSNKGLVDVSMSNYFIWCDYLVNAIGSCTNIDTINSLKIKTDKNNYIVVNNVGKTNKKKVYAGGDVCGNCGSVAKAIKAGLNSGKEIYNILSK